MNARELIDLICQIHRAHPTLPEPWPPAPEIRRVSGGGVAVVGTSREVFEAPAPGAPTDDLVCHEAEDLTTLLDRLTARRASEGKATFAILVPVEDADARRALAEDLSARVHLPIASDVVA